MDFQLKALVNKLSDTTSLEEEYKLQDAVYEICSRKDLPNHEVIINDLRNYILYGCSNNPSLISTVDRMINDEEDFLNKLSIYGLLKIRARTGLSADTIFNAFISNGNLSADRIERLLRSYILMGNRRYFDVVPNYDIYIKGEDLSKEIYGLTFSPTPEEFKTFDITKFYKEYVSGYLSSNSQLRGVRKDLSLADVEYLYACLRISSNRSKRWCLEKFISLLRVYSTVNSFDIPCLYYSDEYGTETDKFVLMSTNDYIKLIGSSTNSNNPQSTRNIVFKTYYSKMDSTKSSNRVFYDDLYSDLFAQVPTFSCNLRLNFPSLSNLRVFEGKDGSLGLVNSFSDYAEMLDYTNGNLRQHGTSTSRNSRSKFKCTVPLFSPESINKN